MITRLGQGLDWLDAICAKVTAVAIWLVMLAIVTDVVCRYVFDSPLMWLYDLVAIYFVNLVLYFMASETLRVRGHIALDLHARLLPERAWALLQGVAWCAVAGVMLLMVWVVVGSTLESWKIREVHPGLYEWPVWLEKGLVALGLLLLLLRVLLRLFGFLLRGGDAAIFHADESAR